MTHWEQLILPLSLSFSPVCTQPVRSHLWTWYLRGKSLFIGGLSIWDGTLFICLCWTGEWSGDKRKWNLAMFQFSFFSHFPILYIWNHCCSQVWCGMGLTIWKVCVHQKLQWMFFLTSTKLKIFLIPNGVKKLFCVSLSENTANFITVLCIIFMQICNLFLYHKNAGVLWIFVKVLNRTVFTVIIYVNCHL